MKLTIAEILSELRDAAREDASEIDPRVMTEVDFLEWEAADLIEELMAALGRIRDGADNPSQIARDVLDEKARRIRSLQRVV
ncbi:hypothetical protein [Bosea vaviloviae]|uniref:Uncharacterized protein n=1 Tax=Bosea vaviloviae TaxID=1526658 RepID=A0A0N1FG07_9HYPH|nr:hypothetical protein [Bosea vaviloviae]KPH79332.1 hypothetical protein AE618_18685 [Bosea vaviloviae]